MSDTRRSQRPATANEIEDTDLSPKWQSGSHLSAICSETGEEEGEREEGGGGGGGGGEKGRWRREGPHVVHARTTALSHVTVSQPQSPPFGLSFTLFPCDVSKLLQNISS